MLAAMKMSSHPSALKSSTLGPHGQYVSTPTESDTSANRPPPWFANSSLPKMKRAFPSGIIPAATVAVSALRPSAFQSPVAIEVEHLHPHRAPGGFRKVLRGRVAEMLPALVQPEVIPSLHVQDVEVGEPVIVDVERRGIAAPAEIHQPDFARDVLEAVAAQIVVQNARFGALGVEV